MLFNKLSHIKRWYNRFIISKKRKQEIVKEYKVFINEFPFDCVIAGGTLRDYFLEGKVNKAIDVDIFFLSAEERDKAKIWLDGVVNGDSLARLVIGDVHYHKHSEFDVIFNFVFHKLYKDAQQLIDSFDFTVCAIAIHKNNIYFNSRFFKDLYNKDVNVINLETQVNVLCRLAKYKQKGFKVSKELLIKIFDYNRKTPEKLFKEWSSYNNAFVNTFSLDRACKILGVTTTCKLKRITSNGR